MATSPRRPQAGAGFGRRGRRKSLHVMLDPDLWGLAAGTLFGTLVLLVDFFRDDDYSLDFPVVIGAALTFVVSYLAAGLFVWYLHVLREREQSAKADARRRQVEGPAEPASPPAGQPEEGL